MEEKDETLIQIKKVKALTEDILEYQSIDTQNAYELVNRRIGHESRKHFFLRMISQVAVILLLPLLISTLALAYLYLGRHEELPSVAYTQVHSAPGTVTRLELPDRSVVWLNSGSTLDYPSVFSGKKREVLLSGEGYFEVNSDLEHPFYVTTKEGLKVMAYGTRFNVNAYDDEPVIEAVLERGKIDVINENGHVQLEPNKQAVYNINTGQFTVSQVNMDEKIGWKDGRLVFRNASLEVVLKRLSKRYNIDIVLHKKSNKDYKYRATFTTETIEQILNYLKLTAPIEWSVKSPQKNQDDSFVPPRIDVYLR